MWFKKKKQKKMIQYEELLSDVKKMGDVVDKVFTPEYVALISKCLTEKKHQMQDVEKLAVKLGKTMDNNPIGNCVLATTFQLQTLVSGEQWQKALDELKNVKNSNPPGYG